MAECMTQLSLDFHPSVPLTVTFDAPHISSDGGALVRRQRDDHLRLSARLAAWLPGSVAVPDTAVPEQRRHTMQVRKRNGVGICRLQRGGPLTARPVTQAGVRSTSTSRRTLLAPDALAVGECGGRPCAAGARARARGARGELVH